MGLVTDEEKRGKKKPLYTVLRKLDGAIRIFNLSRSSVRANESRDVHRYLQTEIHAYI